MEYSVNKTGTDDWRDSALPQIVPSTKSALIEAEWEQIWFTDNESTAIAAAPPGYEARPRPPRPH